MKTHVVLGKDSKVHLWRKDVEECICFLVSAFKVTMTSKSPWPQPSCSDLCHVLGVNFFSTVLCTLMEVDLEGNIKRTKPMPYVVEILEPQNLWPVIAKDFQSERPWILEDDNWEMSHVKIIGRAKNLLPGWEWGGEPAASLNRGQSAWVHVSLTFSFLLSLSSCKFWSGKCPSARRKGAKSLRCSGKHRLEFRMMLACRPTRP